jgi:hypothetical protein
MSTVPREAASTTDESLNLLFDYPGADIILRSQDFYHFRVSRIYITNSSPILRELMRRTLEGITSGGAVTRKRRSSSVASHLHFPRYSTPTIDS